MGITWEIIRWIILGIIVINELAAIFTVFRERRDIAATWAWLLVLTLIPVIGFIIYAFLGRKPMICRTQKSHTPRVGVLR